MNRSSRVLDRGRMLKEELRLNALGLVDRPTLLFLEQIKK